MNIRLTSLMVMAVCTGIALASCASSGGGKFSTSADFSPYTAVYVAPVEISDGLMRRASGPTSRLPGNSDRPISTRDVNQKAGDFRRALISELGRRQSIASGPGSNVITVYTTLTDLEASRPTQADYQAQPGLSFQSEYTGKASATFVLKGGDKQLAAFSDSYDGHLDDSRRASLWGDADYAFRRWGRQLAAAISGS